MKKMLKLMSIIVAVLMLMTMISGCGAEEKKDTSAENSVAESTAVQPTPTEGPKAPDRATVVIYKLTWGGSKDFDSNAVKEKIEELIKDTININLDVRLIPGAEYGGKLNIAIATNAQLDAFVAGGNDIGAQYSKPGLVRPLNDLLDQYGSNLKKVIPQGVFDQVSMKGQVLCIPGVVDAGGAAIVTRQDILDKYGITLPTTIEELEAACQALIEKDKNIVPITGAWWDIMNILCPALDCIKFDGHIIDDAKQMIYSGQHDPNFYKVFAKIREWVDKGYLDRDFLASNFDNNKQLFMSGKNVFTFNHYWRTHDWSPEAISVDPNAHLTIIPELNGKGQWSNAGSVGEVVIVNNNSKYPERIVQYMDWLLSDPNNYMLGAIGIPGKHYKEVGTDQFDQGDWNTLQYNQVYNIVGFDGIGRQNAKMHPFWYEAKEKLQKTKWQTDILYGKVFLDTSIEADFPKITTWGDHFSKFLDGTDKATPEAYQKALDEYFANGGNDVCKKYYQQYLDAKK